MFMDVTFQEWKLQAMKERLGFAIWCAFWAMMTASHLLASPAVSGHNCSGVVVAVG